VVRGPDGLRLYYAGWGTKEAPPGSCVYVQGDAGVTSVEGVFGIQLAAGER
jgi:hypothetical protein